MLAQIMPYLMTWVLAVAMLIEMRTGKIPNWLTLVPFALFIILAIALDDKSVLMWSLGLGVLVFIAGLLLFAFAGFGAGAVKLMSGLALFIPLDNIWAALGMFIFSLFVVGWICIQARRRETAKDSKWVVLNRNVLPMSIPLTITALSVFFLF